MRLQHDLEQVYNRLPHASLEKQTPEHRWESSSRPLIPLSDESLLQAFMLPLEPAAPFLQAKGISPVIAARFEVAAFHGKGFLKDCIGVRLHDQEGYPLGYMGRRLREADIMRWGKYKLPSGFPKADVLYGWHRCRPLNPRVLIVTECAWVVLRLAALGFPAVALLGCHASGRQLARLRTLPRLTLLLDGDRAGRKGARGVAEQLRASCRVDIAPLPDGMDPDELDYAALRKTVSFV